MKFLTQVCFFRNNQLFMRKGNNHLCFSCHEFYFEGKSNKISTPLIESFIKAESFGFKAKRDVDHCQICVCCGIVALKYKPVKNMFFILPRTVYNFYFLINFYILYRLLLILNAIGVAIGVASVFFLFYLQKRR